MVKMVITIDTLLLMKDAKGDIEASTSGFTIVAAKAAFEELIGQKCMGVHIELEDQHYIWKGE